MLDRLDRRLRKLPAGARVPAAREQVVQLRGLTRQIDALHRELAELVKAHRPKLLAELGCGALTAAILIGHTAGDERFGTDASFALQTGTAPIPCSSGKRTQHRLNRGGDRQLNHALHIIAITRAQRTRHPGIARAQGSRRQDHQGSAAVPQAPPRAPLPPPPRRATRRPAASHRADDDRRSPSCPRSPSVPARSERSSRSAQRPSQWSASARATRHTILSAVLPRAVARGERPPPTRAPRTTTIPVDTTVTDINRRVLSPTETLDARSAT